MGRKPLKLTPGLCDGMASAIDLARVGIERSLVPPEGLQTTQIYYGQGGERSRLGPSPTAPIISLFRQPESTGCILTSRQILTTVWCTTSSTGTFFI